MREGFKLDFRRARMNFGNFRDGKLARQNDAPNALRLPELRGSPIHRVGLRGKMQFEVGMFSPNQHDEAGIRENHGVGLKRQQRAQRGERFLNPAVAGENIQGEIDLDAAFMRVADAFGKIGFGKTVGSGAERKFRHPRIHRVRAIRAGELQLFQRPGWHDEFRHGHHSTNAAIGA